MIVPNPSDPMKRSEDEVSLRVSPEVMETLTYVRGDIIDLDTPRAKGRYEVVSVDPKAGLLTVRPHTRTQTSARPNRHERRRPRS